MTHITEAEIRRLSWYGLKPMIKKLMLLPGINHSIIAIGRLLPNKNWVNRIPVSRNVVSYTLSSGETIDMLHPDMCDIAKEIFWARGKRLSRADQMVMYYVELMGKSSILFLDIGSYSGLFSLVAAKSNKSLTVRAYEIVPDNYILLVTNVVMNGFQNRVKTYLRGLSNSRDELMMPKMAGLSNLPSSFSLSSKFLDGIVISINKIDDELNDFKNDCFMKIDVEGFEPEVLKGGAKFIAQNKPDIICEVLLSQDTAPQIHECLDRHGYKYFLFTDDGIVLHDRIVPSKLGRDWLFSIKNDEEIQSLFIDFE